VDTHFAVNVCTVAEIWSAYVVYEKAAVSDELAVVGTGAMTRESTPGGATASLPPSLRQEISEDFPQGLNVRCQTLLETSGEIVYFTFASFVPRIR